MSQIADGMGGFGIFPPRVVDSEVIPMVARGLWENAHFPVGVAIVNHMSTVL